MKERNMILIADDQLVNRKILAHIFNEQFALIEAKDGEEAIEMIDGHQEELVLILLDLVMPKIDGFGVLRFLAEAGLDDSIPTILITGDTSQATELRCYEYKVAGIMSKPFDLKLVMRRVTSAIEMYNNKRQLENTVQLQTKQLIEQYNELHAINDRLRTVNDELQAVNDGLRKHHQQVCEIFCSLLVNREIEGRYHLERVSAFVRILCTYLIAEYPEYGITPREMEQIVQASTYYDIGKITVPDRILFKPGTLDADEWSIMQTHTLAGRGILQDLDCFEEKGTLEFAMEICHYHHERFDGSGYPEQLKGDNIPICAQLVSIAEAYAALLRSGSYRHAYSQIKAERMILDGECGVFNPKLLDCFRLAKEEMRGVLIKYK